MSVYCVSYDLNRPGQNYEGLYEELKRSASWWHFLDSTWLIATSESSEQLWSRIAPHVDKTDSVLVIKVVNKSAGWLPQEAWNWINQHLQVAA